MFIVRSDLSGLSPPLPATPGSSYPIGTIAINSGFGFNCFVAIFLDGGGFVKFAVYYMSCIFNFEEKKEIISTDLIVNRVLVRHIRTVV